MRIRVEFRNEILGNGTLGEWDEHQTDNIPNVVAKWLAKQVVKDGVARQDGMWIVSQVQCYRTPEELLAAYTKATCVSDSLWEGYCANPSDSYWELWEQAKREESLIRQAYTAATGQELS